MNTDKLDLNVENYSQEDLLSLLNLDDKEDVTYEDIINSTTPFINKYAHENNYDLSNFFQQIQNSLIEDLDNTSPDNVNIQNNESSQLGNLWKNEYVSQQDTDENQYNKITQRKQKVSIYKNNDNYVMTKQHLGVSNTYNVPVAQGQINPNLKNTSVRIINIDSQYRDNIVPFNPNPNSVSSPTNYTLDLTDPIHNAISIKLTSYQIPYTWYTIDKEYLGNNCFFIDNSMISISSGNYNPQNLVSAIQDSINSSGIIDVDISYSSINGKTIISSTGSYTITFFDPSGLKTCQNNCSTNEAFNNNLGWILGFRGNTIINNNSPLYGQMVYNINNNTITSEAFLDTFGPKYFLLILDDYKQNHLNKGLVGITPTQKYAEIPSYWNSNLDTSLEGCSIPSDSNKKTPTYIQNAPRRLTQAQLYTLNETTHARSQTKKNRLTAPTNSDVLALLPLRLVNSLAPGKIIIDDFNLDDAERVYFGPVDLQRFRIRLVDDKGYTVNLNGNDWSFTLSATSLYQY